MGRGPRSTARPWASEQRALVRCPAAGRGRLSSLYSESASRVPRGWGRGDGVELLGMPPLRLRAIRRGGDLLLRARTVAVVPCVVDSESTRPASAREVRNRVRPATATPPPRARRRVGRKATRRVHEQNSSCQLLFWAARKHRTGQSRAAPAPLESRRRPRTRCRSHQQ